MSEILTTKEELLNKLRAYADTPDDDNIRIKEQIKDTFLNCPELLYAIHNKELEPELFDEDGNLNIDEDGNLTGEVDRYFGDSSNIRPFLFIPETQDEVKNYVCYQTSYGDFPRQSGYSKIPSDNNKEKILIITFTIFVNGKDSMDKLTGIPRHDLIASIIREKFAWIGLEISTTTPFGDRESTTDNNYLVRTLQYETILPNSICKTEGKNTYYNNKRW